jgi:hypothetical protein
MAQHPKVGRPVDNYYHMRSVILFQAGFKPTKLDSDEQAKIAKAGLEMKLVTSEMDAEAEKWDEPQNEIAKVRLRSIDIHTNTYSYIFIVFDFFLFFVLNEIACKEYVIHGILHVSIYTRRRHITYDTRSFYASLLFRRRRHTFIGDYLRFC